MESRRSEIQVGLAVLVSLVVLVGGVIWGKGYRLRTQRFVIEVVFDNVGGMEPGSNVLANGVVKGRVQKITLHEGKVWVRAAVDESVTLYSDYRITIESPTVMAGKALALYPGEKLPPADISKPLHGQSPLGVGEAVGIFENISSDLRTALKNLNALLVNLNTVAGDTANQRNISNLLSDASGTAHTTNEWVTEHRDDLSVIVSRLDSTLQAAQHLVAVTENRLATTLTGVDSAAADLRALSSSLRSIADRMTDEDGSLGKLMKDDELYRQLNRTLQQVDSLAESIRVRGLRNRIVLF